MLGKIDIDAYRRMSVQVEAQPIREHEISTPLQHKDAILALYNNGYAKGKSIGWRCLDQLFTVRPGEFTVITGIPGHGKSSWLDNVMVNLSRTYSWKWAVFSAENFPIARHIAGLMEIYAGKPFLRGTHERLSSTEVQLCLDWTQQYFQFFQPTEDGYSLNRIVELAALLDGLNGLVIDPWNELDHSRKRDQREDEFISVNLSKLRWLARAAGIHVFVVAHPAKFHRIPGQDKPVITLNDVKGASEWYAKADNGISIWRDEGDTDNRTEVHVQKIRFRDVGHVGKADLYYDRVTGRFTDPNHKPTIDELMAAHPNWGIVGREPGEEG